MIEDLTNNIFGKLHPITLEGINKYRQAVWLCQCECGNFKIARAIDLKNGKIKSCGCLKQKSEQISYKKLYAVWQSMKQRCLNKKNKDYKNYGGRGIKICQEWLDNFMNFYNWAINSGYKENVGLSIDRINVNEGYCPDNCRWTDNKNQARNRRTNRKITYKGETHCVSEWLSLLGLIN